MMFISAEEWQLLSFFEVEPTKLDAGECWSVNELEYSCPVGDLQVAFRVAPWHKSCELTVDRAGTTFVKLLAESVFDIRYHARDGSEWLEILLSPDERLELRLKPTFSLVGRIPGRQLDT
jgi:hypothetical protein